MGTLNFTVSRYSRQNGQILSTERRTSGAYTTSTSASNVEDSGGDITLAVGDVFVAEADEAMWINFAGNAATVGGGFYLSAGVTREWECAVEGTVSAIDVA